VFFKLYLLFLDKKKLFCIFFQKRQNKRILGAIITDEGRIKHYRKETALVLITGAVEEDLSRWKEAYINWMRSQDFPANTQNTYKRIIERFEKFIREDGKATILTDINKQTFSDFLLWLDETKKGKGGKYSQSTKNLFYSGLKSFFDYITGYGDPDKETGEVYSFLSEFKGLMRRRRGSGRKKAKTLKENEIINLLDFLALRLEERGSHYDYIYSLIVKLMMYGGLRATEALGLRLEDFEVSTEGDDLYDVTLHETKSGEPQVILVRRDLIEKELDYFRETIYDDEYIFKGLGASNPIDRTNLYKALKKIYEKAGVRRTGIHILRHTSAMLIQKKTKDITITKEHLRHSSITTTMIYVNTSKRDIANAIR